jgi:branched-chain amino acid transport system permease protein
MEDVQAWCGWPGQPATPDIIENRSMSVQLLIDQILNGLTLGSLYALVALGLTLTFGVVRMVNFAHGEFFMVAAYLFWILRVQIKISYLPAVGLTIMAMALVGAIFERLIVHPILERPWYIHVVATLSVSAALVSGAILLFTTSPRAVPTPYTRIIYHLGPFSLSLQRILIFTVTVVSFAVLNLFVQRTKLGKAMRAMSQDREVCTLLGIDARRISLVTFSIGAALAGLAATLIVPVFVVIPDMGSLITLKAFATIIVGGMGNVRGTILGAFLLGIAEALTAGYIASEYATVAPFVLMILVLMFRPHGMFGRKVGL